MAQTTAQRKKRQRARDRLRLRDAEYKRIERDKRRAYRARKNPKPKRTTIINNQQPSPLLPQPQVQSKPSKNKKSPQQLISE